MSEFWINCIVCVVHIEWMVQPITNSWFLKEVVNKYHVKGSWKILSNGSYEGYSYK